jgi:hypothetical protein
MNARCKDVEILLIEYREDSLDPDQRKKVREHLAVCESCRVKLEELQHACGLLAEDVVPPAEESFWIDFLPQVRSRIEQKQRLRWVAWPKIRWAVGLVSVLALVTVGSLLLTREKMDLVQQEAEQPEETTLALTDPYNYADQLAEVISSDSGGVLPVETLLADGGVEDLGLAEELLEEDYISQSDVNSMLSELNTEELKQLEQNVRALKIEDIL